ncbi:hypothetical protein J6590_016822 [Homalodisca vitripennis]|nr:hypothetical protein J6590_016822 [Homalodisca vitripennis]
MPSLNPRATIIAEIACADLIAVQYRTEKEVYTLRPVPRYRVNIQFPPDSIRIRIWRLKVTQLQMYERRETNFNRLLA